jgi:hypothetical protein
MRGCLIGQPLAYARSTVTPESQAQGNNNVSRRLFTDGRKVSATTPKGENVEMTARWQGSQLVVVTQRANGSKLIQTYMLDQGAGHLIISTQITGGSALIAQSGCVLSTTLKPGDRRNVTGIVIP